MAEPPSDKKLFVDEDWKSQIERERAMQDSAGEPVAGAGPDAPPPADLSTIFQLLAMQAMLNLGMLVQQEGDQPVVRLSEAKHWIDLLDVLEAKTKGNRTPEESEQLELLLYQFRLAYVQLGTQAPLGPDRPAPGKSIIT